MSKNWIAVAERLPGEEEDYEFLVSDGEEIDMCYRYNGKWMLLYTCEIYKYKVTHWMPLPEPPK